MRGLQLGPARVDVDLRRLRSELEDSRDFLFNAAGIPQNLFRPN